MEVLMVRSRINTEAVADVQAAVEKMLAALDTAQPEGIRYASLLVPDGETVIALLQIDDGVENPLPDLPEYKELLGIVEGVRSAPPVVEKWTLVGSYRLF